ncbi:MAG: DUF2207 domain-containing protein, partial [Planctomycetota bacterium]
MKRAWIAALVVAMIGAGLASADTERILRFDSRITVQKDGSMEVAETIRVRAEGREIKHGIYRDFPTVYRVGLFSRHMVPFKVEDVLRDGRNEAYHIKGLKNGKRVYVGRENALLQPGEYTYTLVYRTDRQIGLFKDHDELYWNVTGNGWAFVIEEAGAEVTLPEGVPSDEIRLEGYTGAQGAKGRDWKAEVNEEGRPVFSTTRALAPLQGLTIVVSWPKGYVAEPTESKRALWTLRDNASLAVGLIGAFVVLVYYLVAWSVVGRDPAKGTIIPQFDAPKGLSPADVRYLRKMGYDDKCLAAAVIDLAVKGCVEIEDEKGVYTIRSTGKDHPEVTLEERDILEKLAGSAGEIVFKQTNHAKIRSMIDAFKETQAGRFGRLYFARNRGYLAVGVGLSLATLLGTGLVSTGGGEKTGVFVFLCVWLSVWSVVVAALLVNAFQSWRGVRGGRVELGAAQGATLFALAFLFFEVFAIFMLVKLSSGQVIVILGLLICLNALFSYLMKAYTREGRKIVDGVEGLRMYLRAAEEERLNFMYAPKRTVEVFEKFLPYALALDVENAWAEQFSEVLERSGREGYSPAWYHGTVFATAGVAGFASAMGSSLSGAISSSSTAPGSSSGGGGGGSSGGGGGGGGGG